MLSDLLHPARSHPNVSTMALPDVCTQYRKALRWSGIVCPAEVLWIPATADWVLGHEVSVEARSSADLSLAVSRGIAPARLIVHCDGPNAGLIRCGVNAGVRQFVVDSGWQVSVLAHYARQPRNVLVDVTAGLSKSPVEALLASDGLNAVGLHCRVEAADRYADVILSTLEMMAQIRWETGRLLTRLSLSTMVGADPRRLGTALEDALDDACARFRFPRPGVAVSLRWPVVRGVEGAIGAEVELAERE